ncbi:hypothetical protein [Natronorubrum tibetense]|nr:hypothetical protein [Natronorubrum tibetense]
MEFAVSRDGTTFVTLHGGSDTTARDGATEELATTLEALEADGTIADWSVDDANVYEHPTGPFDPYTVSVAFSVTVAIEADNSEAAAEAGSSAIDEALEAAEVDSVTYTSSPAASAV